jgi:hypothetical protein
MDSKHNQISRYRISCALLIVIVMVVSVLELATLILKMEGQPNHEMNLVRAQRLLIPPVS